MPFDILVIVALIAAAFLVFAVALAYGQILTQNLKRDSKPQTDEQEWRKAA